MLPVKQPRFTCGLYLWTHGGYLAAHLMGCRITSDVWVTANSATITVATFGTFQMSRVCFDVTRSSAVRSTLWRVNLSRSIFTPTFIFLPFPLRTPLVHDTLHMD